MAEILRPRDHRCDVLAMWPHHGTIIRCSTCGTVWRGVEPGNPHYAGWRRVGRLELRLRLWLAARNTRRAG